MTIIRNIFHSKNDSCVLRSKIAVAGLSPGCGTSLISGLIADKCKSLGSVSVIECAAPHFYDALNFDKRFIFEEYVDYFDMLRKKMPVKSVENISDGIHWICRRTGDDASLGAGELFRLLSLPDSEYSIFDCSGLCDELLFDFIAQCDKKVLVIDPIPGKLVRYEDRLAKFRFSFPDLIVVVNKFNKGIYKAELERFLGFKNYIEVPAVPLDLIYKAEYICSLVSSLPGAEKYISAPQDILIKSFNKH